MSFSTHGSTPGSERTRGSAVDFASPCLADAVSSGRSRKAATATTMANATARIIAPTPTLRSGSPSNQRVRSRSRTAEPLYLPPRRVVPARVLLAGTTRKIASGSPPSSAGVPPALPLSKRPLFPMIPTPSLPLCSEVNRRDCTRKPSERCDARCIIYCLGSSFYIVGRKSPRRAEGSDRTNRSRADSGAGPERPTCDDRRRVHESDIDTMLQKLEC